MPQLVAPGSEEMKNMIREEIGLSEARVVKEVVRRWSKVDRRMEEMYEVMSEILVSMNEEYEKVDRDRIEGRSQRRIDVEVSGRMEKVLGGLHGQLKELADLAGMVEANLELAEGVRGAQQHFEREVRGLRTQVVAGVESMVRSVDVVKREVRGCGQMMRKVGEQVWDAVGCVQTDSGVQWGRVETRLGDVEREVKEQWHDRHRELVAQLRSLAREVRIAKGSSVAVDSGPPQGFVAAAEVEWGARPGFEFRLGGMGLGYYRHRDGGLRVAESGKRRVEMEGDRRSRGGRLRSEDRREGVQYFAVPLTSK
jgi:hypothetical protein